MQARSVKLAGPLVVAMLAAAAIIAVSASASRAAGTSCKELSASRIPAAALKASYRKLTGLAANRPLNGSQPRRFGVCGATHYAFELFTVKSIKGLSYHQQVAQQDHSAVWKQKSNGPWVDEGLDNPCKLAPPALINLWNIGDNCET